jgi:hypothetical protein
VLLLLLASCVDGSDTQPIDPSDPDQQGMAQLDATREHGAGERELPACTGSLYDDCVYEASNNCASRMCHDFVGRGFTVCTQPCDATNPCPAQDGAVVECNTKGICVPYGPNFGCSAP